MRAPESLGFDVTSRSISGLETAGQDGNGPRIVTLAIRFWWTFDDLGLVLLVAYGRQ